MNQRSTFPDRMPIAAKHQQRGTVLAVSLIFLLILTILGISSMKSTVLEEKMAGNMRDQSLAFQAAEAALRDAEAYIETLASTGAFTCTEKTVLTDTSFPSCSASSDGQFANGTIFNDILEQNPWSSTNGSVAASTPIIGVNTAPRYFIIHNADLTDAAKTSLNLGPGYGGLGAGKDITTFTIVARGTGGTDKAPLILATYYGRRF